MSTTIMLAENITANGNGATVQVSAGDYLFGASGPFDSGTLQLYVNIGAAKGVPITDAAFTDAGSVRVSLPTCTAFVTMSGATAPDVTAGLAKLSAKIED